MNAELQALIDKLEPRLRDAFRQAVAVLREGIDYPALVRALRSGNVDSAIDALNIERGAFSGYVLERQAAFAEAGAFASQEITKSRRAQAKRETSPFPSITSPPIIPPFEPPPAITLPAPGGGDIVFRFDMTNPRAELKIRTEAAARVVGYVDEQIETTRRVIGDGFQRGDGPQNIARDIAGRINPISGRREGGIIGLSDPQVGYVDSMRRRLLSGDPEQMMKVLGRFDREGKWVPGTGQTLRDRRFDAQIKKAIRDVAAGKPNPLSRAKVDEMVAKYSDRLLARRAEDIARTETAQGVMLARSEATAQALDRAGLPDQAVKKAWRHLGSDGPEAREDHVAMAGTEVTGIQTPFLFPDGTAMQHSHDPAGGVKHNANCRCGTDFRIDWAFGLN
jgi:hypothetical protein